MKSDLDTLMQSRGIDAILVTGNADHNPPMYYLTGGGHIGAATLIKQRGGEAVLFCNDMERDEAAKTGLKIIPYSTYNLDVLLKETNGDAILASALRYKHMFTDQGIQGHVGLYGNTELGSAFATFTRLQELMPELELLGETNYDFALHESHGDQGCS